MNSNNLKISEESAILISNLDKVNTFSDEIVSSLEQTNVGDEPKQKINECLEQLRALLGGVVVDSMTEHLSADHQTI